jgi:REP element-mobilizing transposase RayT
MTMFRNKYRVEGDRMRILNYSAPGQYFITNNIQNRHWILGHVVNQKMVYSEYGEIVKKEVLKIPEYHPRIILDEWVVMPNHFHLLIVLKEYGYYNGISEVDDYNMQKNHEFYLSHKWWNKLNYQPTKKEVEEYCKLRRRMVIPKLMGKLQMKTSKGINILRKTPGTKNWQHDYHDHVIRDERSYRRIKNYIINNPKNWKGDTFFDGA